MHNKQPHLSLALQIYTRSEDQSWHDCLRVVRACPEFNFREKYFWQILNGSFNLVQSTCMMRCGVILKVTKNIAIAVSPVLFGASKLNRKRGASDRNG